MSEPRDRDEPVSLAPLDPAEALRALLAVKPGSGEAERPPVVDTEPGPEPEDGGLPPRGMA